MNAAQSQINLAGIFDREAAVAQSLKFSEPIALAATGPEIDAGETRQFRIGAPLIVAVIDGGMFK